MDIGVLGVFQNWHKDMSDEQMFVSEIEMLERSESLGFDSIWMAEHHFDDYSMCPDNMQALSYLAGRTKKIKLATGAVILPWNNPLRVVEKITMLDHLSGGRMMFGMGRGLAKMEYAGMGIDMNEARERFDEAAPMIIKGLETGFIEGDGKHYPQKRMEIRPKPSRGIRDRLYCVAMSPDSVDVAAELGATMTSFIQHDISKHAPEILRYKELFKKHHGREAPPPVLTDFLYCDHDMQEAERVSKEHIAKYFLSVVKHYEFAGTHFDATKGYKSYGEAAALIREFGLEAAAEAYRNAQSWGNPEKILKNYARWKDLIGPFSLNTVFSYAGLTFDQVERSQRLFAKEVMPELRKMMDAPMKAAA
tara:strand:- start:14245 stop:15333 length:1089 start_codon:yes stop_codon:yes gene_type:complete